MDKSIYYSYDKVLSYDAMLNFIIGERGVGKTYGAKKFVIKHFLKTGKQFAFIRRYGSDLESAIGSSDKPEFFKAIQKEFPDIEFTIDTTKDKKLYYLYADNKCIGYAMSLRSAESLKGTEFSKVDTIIFDEFLVGDGGSHYITNEPMFLLSIIESVARLRHVRVLCLGNATSVVNPYFEFFNIYIPYNSDIKTFKEGTILVNYIKNLAYREAKKESTFGKLIAGTPYEKYAIENKFVKDSNTFIAKKTPGSKLFFNILLNGNYYGVWLDKYNMYISKSYNANYNIILTFDYSDHNEKTVLMRSKSVFMKNLVLHYEHGCLFFENQEIKHAISDLLMKSHLL